MANQSLERNKSELISIGSKLNLLLDLWICEPNEEGKTEVKRLHIQMQNPDLTKIRMLYETLLKDVAANQLGNTSSRTITEVKQHCVTANP